MLSGTGTSELAGTVKYSAHAPRAPAVATRWPMVTLSTPSPSASTTPIASLPAIAGKVGL